MLALMFSAVSGICAGVATEDWAMMFSWDTSSAMKIVKDEYSRRIKLHARGQPRTRVLGAMCLPYRVDRYVFLTEGLCPGLNYSLLRGWGWFPVIPSDCLLPNLEVDTAGSHEIRKSRQLRNRGRATAFLLSTG